MLNEAEMDWKNDELNFIHQWILPKVISLLPTRENLNILDAGCGNGATAFYLSKLDHRVTGIDLSESGIAIASKYTKNIVVKKMSVYDSLHVLVPQNGFDCIISLDVIEHLYSPEKFLFNMYNNLASDGALILSTPYHGYLKNLMLSLCGRWDHHFGALDEGGHIKFFSEETLKKLLNATGFKNVKFSNAGRFPYIWKSIICVAYK